jgi:hypothetical protein
MEALIMGERIGTFVASIYIFNAYIFGDMNWLYLNQAWILWHLRALNSTKLSSQWGESLSYWSQLLELQSGGIDFVYIICDLEIIDSNIKIGRKVKQKFLEFSYNCSLNIKNYRGNSERKQRSEETNLEFMGRISKQYTAKCDGLKDVNHQQSHTLFSRCSKYPHKLAIWWHREILCNWIFPSQWVDQWIM